MKCPVCGTPDLLMAERQGVEIDYCPSCRGVWLDRGELDKLIERTEGGGARSAPAVHDGDDQGSRRASQAPRRDHAHRDRSRGDDDRSREYDRPRKKKSLFEMFDFD
ncbi:zf-TFIIB domain-containing protein [Pandoraea soli]|uniref:Transcription factor zinc-finger domain-containing protein n=1 Tax=Pandoraea soli TaxID=2508293 RepID=A0ABY6VR68_9BURK|nr:zf-TFIIB domain-containing protein [Pandoraea soli]VVD78424.1 hypothetical protein PSO31014_00965 [Pandoraea soli]